MTKIDDIRDPLKVRNDRWIHAYAPLTEMGIDPNSIGAYVGKWMLFIPPASITETWVKIRNATRTGKLGISWLN